MNLEFTSSTVKCPRCGEDYNTRRGHFHISYAQNYKGIGYIPICHKCISTMFDQYLLKCHDEKAAMRQVCRKLDLYWHDDIYEYVKNRSASKTLVVAYIKRITNTNYVGKSYDNTLEEEGTLWDFTTAEERSASNNDDGVVDSAAETTAEPEPEPEPEPEEQIEIPQEVIDFWGPSYTPDMYLELEKRRLYWMDRLKFGEGVELPAGTESLIRQICGLEIDINRERADGKSPDKLIATLNTLLGSAQLKPDQKKSDISKEDANTPFGVWIKRWENERPIPEVDPSMRDVDGIKKYVATWFHGHLAKMLGLKKAELAMYEEEIARLRVERPEYNEDDDEELISDFFSEFNSDAGGDEDEEESE